MSAPVRVGVVGTGRWAAAHHIPAVLADSRATLSALCDTRPERLAAARERFGAPHAFTDPARLAASGLVDAVVVATPAARHHVAAAPALDLGLPVLVEKPLTVDPADGWDLVHRAARARTPLVVGLTFQFAPLAALARELVAGGRLGAPVLVAALYSSAMTHLYAGTWPAACRRPSPTRRWRAAGRRTTRRPTCSARSCTPRDAGWSRCAR
jgi:predicted dehydrogenase